MTKLAHTPGPWHATENHHNAMLNGWIGIENAEGVLAYVSYGASSYHPNGMDGFKAEQAANARLIAAAPDLLAALELAVRYMPSDASDNTERQIVNRALAKATATH